MRKPRNKKTHQDKPELILARRSERWAFWTLIAGLAAILVAAFLAEWTVIRSEELARRSGAFDRPRPSLYIENTPIGESSGSLRLFFGARFPGNGLTIVGLPLVVRNDGQRTMKGLQLSVRSPELIAVDNELLTFRADSVIPVNVSPERHFIKLGNFAYSSYALPELHPSQSIRVIEPVRLSDSRIEDRFSAVSKDGAPFTVGLSFLVGFQVTVTIAGEDLHPTDYGLDVIGMRGNSQDELRQSFARVAQQEVRQNRERLGFWRYLPRLLAREERRAVLLYPNAKLVTYSDGRSLEYAEGPVAVTEAIYPTTSLRLLF